MRARRLRRLESTGRIRKVAAPAFLYRPSPLSSVESHTAAADLYGCRAGLAGVAWGHEGVIEMASVTSRTPGRLGARQIAGIVLVVVAGLWMLLWAGIWYALWELTGTEGVVVLALDWRFLGPTALGLIGLAIGVHLATPRREPLRLGELGPDRKGPGPSHESPDATRRRASRRSAARAVGIAAVVVAGIVVLQWAASRSGDGPYPFADVPTGHLIAYSAPDGIRLARADGSRSWLVPGTGDLSGPVWSPDGQRLAAVDLWDCCKAYSLAVDGSARTRLPANTDTTPEWSPDGRRLAVAGENDAARIVIRSVEGGAPDLVLPMPGNDPDWSPDGTLVAFQSYGGGEVLRIYVVRHDGSGLRAVTTGDGNGTGASQAAWAPDGRRIAFTADFDGDEDIYVVRVDGTGLRKVTHNSVDDMTPSWSPDGRRLVFGRSTADLEDAAIVVVDLATGAETEIAEGDLVFEPAWQPSS